MTDEEPTLKKQSFPISLTVEMFVNDIYRDTFREHLEEHLNFLRFGETWGRKYHLVKHPNPAYPEHNAAKEEFARRWYALIEEGTRGGFLEYGPDGDYIIRNVPEFIYETVYDETEEECEARRARLVTGKVTGTLRVTGMSKATET